MDKERYSRSNRDDGDRDSSVDRSPEREGGRRHRDGDSKRRDSDHYRSSRRDDRDDERDRSKDRARERGRSVERSEREGSRDREKHHHERSHEKESRSKRKEREEENGGKEGKKKSRFSDGNGERRSRFEDVSMESEKVNQGFGAMNTTSGVTEIPLKIEKLTHYVEHPRPIEPPAEAAPPPPQPLKLTKREQKKLRTQRRLAKEKEKQEMIRQGLLEPPKGKVKMSNLMKVLGSEATQDPTKLEKEIRTAAAEREQAHTDRNAARKLTPAEKREKKERKLFDDPTTVETIVSVYKINKLSHPKIRFKVEMNARENRFTGCSVMTEGMSVVVVEGKSKAIKRYGKLMLRRINWDEAVKDEEKEEDDEEDRDENRSRNKCWLVWQGSVAKQSFYRFIVQDCLTESAAKKVFTDAGVGHYWDLALSYSDD